MPGAGFQRKAREWKEAVYEMRDAPFETVRLAMVSSPNWSSSILSTTSGIE